MELSITFTDRNFIRTRLPQGLTGAQNLLRVVGTVQSASGAVTTAHVDVSVNAAAEAAIQGLTEQAGEVRSEARGLGSRSKINNDNHHHHHHLIIILREYIRVCE